MAVTLSAEDGLLVEIEDADGEAWDYEVERTGRGDFWACRLTKRGKGNPTWTVSCRTVRRLERLIEIDGTTYAVPDAPGLEAVGVLVETVAEEWGCTCPDWRFRYRPNRKRPAGSDCKHVETSRELRRLLAAA